jgi:hypothetical protein
MSEENKTVPLANSLAFNPYLLRGSGYPYLGLTGLPTLGYNPYLGVPPHTLPDLTKKEDNKEEEE